MVLSVLIALGLSVGTKDAVSERTVVVSPGEVRFFSGAGNAPGRLDVNGARYPVSPSNVIEFVAGAGGVPIYLELDGAYFSVPAGTSFEYVPGSWVVPATSMANCGRRNGQVQQFSDFSLLYGPNLDIVYLSTAEASSAYYCAGTTAHEACVLAMQSTTGDIVCSGTVAAPDPIFSNSFDSP